MQVFLNQFSKKIKNMNFKILDNKCTHFKFMEYVFNIPKNLFESVELKVSLELYRLEKKICIESSFLLCEKQEFRLFSVFDFKNEFDDYEFELWFVDLFKSAYFHKFHERIEDI